MSGKKSREQRKARRAAARAEKVMLPSRQELSLPFEVEDDRLKKVRQAIEQIGKAQDRIRELDTHKAFSDDSDSDFDGKQDFNFESYYRFQASRDPIGSLRNTETEIVLSGSDDDGDIGSDDEYCTRTLSKIKLMLELIPNYNQHINELLKKPADVSSLQSAIKNRLLLVIRAYQLLAKVKNRPAAERDDPCVAKLRDMLTCLKLPHGFELTISENGAKCVVSKRVAEGNAERIEDVSSHHVFVLLDDLRIMGLRHDWNESSINFLYPTNLSNIIPAYIELPYVMVADVLSKMLIHNTLSVPFPAKELIVLIMQYIITAELWVEGSVDNLYKIFKEENAEKLPKDLQSKIEKARQSTAVQVLMQNGVAGVYKSIGTDEKANCKVEAVALDSIKVVPVQKQLLPN